MSTPGTTSRHTVPDDSEAAARALAEVSIPGEIIGVAQTLQDANHEAVLVGGAVRDSLLGLPASDWDLATSATPQEVIALFPRTVPTGLEHGTVTVLAPPRRRPSDPKSKFVCVEVTTFRGEGTYEDGRRPSEVVFLRDLHEDLARRDFTFNAFAWDPLALRFSDPFGGLEDLRAGVVRAVGEPGRRFAEDGLRTMRAVRFCASRQCTLDPATEAAIPDALDVLDKVSRERVHVELTKLLAAPKPSLGLVPMVSTQMLPRVLTRIPDVQDAIEAVDRLPSDSQLRLARLLWGVAVGVPDGRSLVERVVEQLKPSKQERARVVALTGPGVEALAAAQGGPQIRRAAARLGREHIESALLLLAAPPARAAQVREACQDAPLTIKELPVGGRDLIEAGVAKPGPALGDVLAELLSNVLDKPTLSRSQLLELARSVRAPRGGAPG